MPETLFLTVNLIDRFLAEKQVTRKNLQLVRPRLASLGFQTVQRHAAGGQLNQRLPHTMCGTGSTRSTRVLAGTQQRRLPAAAAAQHRWA